MHRHTPTLMGAGFLLIVLTTTGLLASLRLSTPLELLNAETGIPYPHQVVSARSTEDLAKLFDAHDYQWPPEDIEAVPMLVLESLPADFAETDDVKARKSLFLRSLTPIVLLENRRLLEQRELCKLLLKQGMPEPDTEAYAWLQDVANNMQVRGDLADAVVQDLLLRRLDEIPLTLALAQAAIESGWGTSRFAQEGNSLFGQWTYKPDAGLIPQLRLQGATHFVRSFPNLQASVRAYMHNLNTGHAYRDFRNTRAHMRATGQPLSPLVLAMHLRNYSQRGVEYVQELQRMIKGRSLAQLELDSLSASPDELASLTQELLDDPS